MIYPTNEQAKAAYEMTARVRPARLRLDRKRYTFRKERRIARMVREAARLAALI